MASSSTDLLDRVLRNDPELQHLYLSSDSTTHVEKLTQALASNTTIKNVYFRNFKLGGSLPLLLHASGQLTNLQSLFFHCTEVPVVLLGQVLTQRKLSAVGMRYCKLKYQTEQDCQTFETALSHHTALEDICMECCEWQLEEGGDNNGNNHNYNLRKMSRFLRAMAQIPSLHHFECVLAATSNLPRQRLSAKTLQSLCQIPQLQTLRLRNIWLPQDDIALLCHCLRAPLQKLIVSCDLGPTSALALGQLLQDSRSLQHLSLRIDHLHDRDCPQLLAQALRHCSLEHFHLSGKAACELSSRAKSAFCEMMQTNVSLEFVRLDVSDYALQSEIAFYLQLNHRGRRELFQKLLQTDCKENESSLWIRALCQNEGDVRALQYLLSLHPGLFALVALESQQSVDPQPACKQQNAFDWGADDGIVYDSDGW